MVVWPFYYFAQLIIIGKLFHNWTYLFMMAILIPLTGIYGIRFYPLIKKAAGKWRLIRLGRRDEKNYNELLVLRKQVVSELRALRIKE